MLKIEPQKLSDGGRPQPFDRMRFHVDAVTILVVLGLGVCVAAVDFSLANLQAIFSLVAIWFVAPQVLQALLAQLTLTSGRWGSIGRGLFMISIWFVGANIALRVVPYFDLTSAVGIALASIFIIVPLAVIRLLVRVIVAWRADRVIWNE